MFARVMNEVYDLIEYLQVSSNFKKKTIDGRKIEGFINIPYISSKNEDITVKGFYTASKTTYFTKRGDILVYNKHDGNYGENNSIENYLREKDL